MQLVLDFISGNERMPKFHDVLCFTIESARPLLSECMSCTHGRCSAKSKSFKTRAGIHFLYTQHMRNIPDVALFGMFRYDVRLARTIGFRTEKRIGSFIVKQKFVCEHVDHSKNCHAWYLLFCYRKCRRTIWFQREIVFQARIFCPKTNDATTFYVQNRWCRCHGPVVNKPGARLP